MAVFLFVYLVTHIVVLVVERTEFSRETITFRYDSDAGTAMCLIYFVGWGWFSWYIYVTLKPLVHGNSGSAGLNEAGFLPGGVAMLGSEQACPQDKYAHARGKVNHIRLAAFLDFFDRVSLAVSQHVRPAPSMWGREYARARERTRPGTPTPPWPPLTLYLDGCVGLKVPFLPGLLGAVHGLVPHVAHRRLRPHRLGTRREPFSFTPVAVNSISSGSPHVRCTPMWALSTCGEPDEIKKNTHPELITALFRAQAPAFTRLNVAWVVRVVRHGLGISVLLVLWWPNVRNIFFPFERSGAAIGLAAEAGMTTHKDPASRERSPVALTANANAVARRTIFSQEDLLSAGTGTVSSPTYLPEPAGRNAQAMQQHADEMQKDMNHLHTHSHTDKPVTNDIFTAI